MEQGATSWGAALRGAGKGQASPSAGCMDAAEDTRLPEGAMDEPCSWPRHVRRLHAAGCAHTGHVGKGAMVGWRQAAQPTSERVGALPCMRGAHRG